MPVSIRIKPFDKTALFSPGGALHPDTAARLVADYARKEISKAEQINREALGREAPKREFVNGVEGAKFETVRPGQSIVAVFDLGGDVVRVIYDLCREHAPVLTGRFRDSIKIYADGVEVGGPDAAVGAKEVVISSVVPYARKIEGDKRAGKKPQSPKAPEGVFEAVAAIARQRFGNIASVKFSYSNPVGGATMLETWAQGHSAKAKKPKRQFQKDTRQPSILITFR